eukprot:scaffold1403_cov381-Prasinococcus_capsulatus_cf.AAC.8
MEGGSSTVRQLHRWEYKLPGHGTGSSDTSVTGSRGHGQADISEAGRPCVPAQHGWATPSLRGRLVGGCGL